MSLDQMCSGSSVDRIQRTHAIGALGGDQDSFSSTGALECNAQTMSAQTARQFDANGERRLWSLFFSSDPDLTPNQWVRLTRQQNQTLATPKILRVLASEFEGNPEGDLALWIVHCDEITTRFDEVA